MYIKKLTMAISRLFGGRREGESNGEGMRGRGLFGPRNRADTTDTGGEGLGLGAGGPAPQDPESFIGYTGPLVSSTANKILPSQNPDRYKKTNTGWEISALPVNPTSKQRAEIKPLKINASEILPLKPILSEMVRGIVVYLISTDEYLCSPSLYSTIKDSYESNPHLFYLENDTISGASIGKSIPIIRIDDTNLSSLASVQESKCNKAGVKKLIWPFDRNRANLLQQIDWTLGDSNKPFDEFSVSDLNLKANYSIEGLRIIPLDKDKKIDEELLKANLKAINDRLAELRDDLNNIKDTYYNGIIPNSSTTDYRIISSTASVNDEKADGEKQVVFKKSLIQSKEVERTNQSITQSQEEAKKLAEEAEANSKTLQQKIDEQASQLDEAQRGDRVAQDNLAKQLRDAQSSISSTRTFAEEQAAKYAKNTK
jgi:hypothetical protein